MVHFHATSGAPQLAGATLVVACEGPGNVGQLAADLLASTFGTGRVGWLEEDALLPAMGAASSSQLAMGLELHCLEPPASSSASKGGLFVLQQRAPASPGLQRAFAARLADWICDSGFAEVLLLGSLDAMFRRDAQLAGTQLRSFSRSDALASRAAALAPPLEADTWFADRPLEQQVLPPWPALVALAGREGAPPAAVLSIFAAEGENLGDAHVLAGAAAQLVGLVPQGGEAAAQQPRWTPPESWQWVFGRGAAVY